MKIFIIFFLILVLFIILFSKLKVYIQKKNRSIEIFLERINKFIEQNDININREYVFKRFIKYKHKNISLGKVIFDDEKLKILIYETFIYKHDKIVCIPDIRMFNYKSLVNCSVFENNEIVKDIKNVTFRKNSNIFIKLEIKNNLYNYVILRLSSINDYEIFIKVYNEFNKIICDNKK